MTKTDLEGKVSTLLNEYHTLSFTPHTKSGTVFHQFITKKPTAGEHILPLRTLSEAEKKQLPFEIQRHIQEYFCSVTKMKELEEADYINFMDYVAVQLVNCQAAGVSKAKVNIAYICVLTYAKCWFVF